MGVGLEKLKVCDELEEHNDELSEDFKEKGRCANKMKSHIRHERGTACRL